MRYNVYLKNTFLSGVFCLVSIKYTPLSSIDATIIYSMSKAITAITAYGYIFLNGITLYFHHTIASPRELADGFATIVVPKLHHFRTACSKNWPLLFVVYSSRVKRKRYNGEAANDRAYEKLCSPRNTVFG